MVFVCILDNERLERTLEPALAMLEFLDAHFSMNQAVVVIRGLTVPETRVQIAS